MGKKYIGIGAAVLVIGLLAGALYFLERTEPDSGTGPASSPTLYLNHILGGEEPVTAREIAVQNAKGGFTLVVDETETEDGRTVKSYTLAGYEGYPVNMNLLSALSTNSDKLLAKSIVAEAGADLAPFGLNRPSVTVDITRADGSKDRMIIGNAAPGSEGHYATNETGTVYLLATANIQNLFHSPLELMLRMITPGDPEQRESMDFTSAVLGGSLRPDPIYVSEYNESMFATHLLTFGPMSAELDLTFGKPDILMAYGLIAAEVAGTESDIARFGLDEPYSTLELNPTEEMGISPFKLSATKPDEDGNIYMIHSESPLVYKLPADRAGWLERTGHDLMSKLVVLPHIDSLAEVIVETPSRRYVFELNGGEGADLVVTYGGDELDIQSFRRYYQNILSASFDAPAEEPLPDSPVPLLKYTYRYSDGSAPEVVSFYEGPARRAFITYNGGIPFYTTTAYVDRVIADTELLIGGGTVTAIM
ncbi:MAG: DUF4340 domain-containing protein [Oscillospiraceae bacterium]|nr:DUF4340 domain-containing protein [Oscillospiraceae bacterium]